MSAVLSAVVVVEPSEEMVLMALVLLHMVEVELPLLVVQVDQEVEILVDSFMVVTVWLLTVVLVALLKVAVAVDQVGMVAVVLVTMNVVGLKQLAVAAVLVMDAQRTQVSKVL